MHGRYLLHQREDPPHRVAKQMYGGLRYSCGRPSHSSPSLWLLSMWWVRKHYRDIRVPIVYLPQVSKGTHFTNQPGKGRTGEWTARTVPNAELEPVSADKKRQSWGHTL